MKPTSIIFLIVSVVLIAAGLATCFIATNMAEADGIALYAHTLDENKNSIFTSDINEKGITKIEIKVDNCNVNVIGDAETSKIELVNFTEGMYSFNVTGKIVTLDETPNIAAMLKFWENGFKFKGMRHIIRLTSNQSSDGGKEKAVNIYLTKAEAVKIMNITVSKGNVDVDSMYSQTDYSLAIESGTASFLSVKTTSTVTVTGKECDINVAQSLLRNLNTEIDSGNIICNTYTFSNVQINLNSGRVFIEATRDLKNYHTTLSTKGGQVVYKEERLDGNFKYESEKGIGDLKVITDSADITVNQRSASPDVADTEG